MDRIRVRGRATKTESGRQMMQTSGGYCIVSFGYCKDYIYQTK